MDDTHLWDPATRQTEPTGPPTAAPAAYRCSAAAVSWRRRSSYLVCTARAAPSYSCRSQLTCLALSSLQSRPRCAAAAATACVGRQRWNGSCVSWWSMVGHSSPAALLACTNHASDLLNRTALSTTPTPELLDQLLGGLLCLALLLPQAPLVLAQRRLLPPKLVGLQRRRRTWRRCQPVAAEQPSGSTRLQQGAHGTGGQLTAHPHCLAP